jgi:beta-lactamase class A
MNARISRRNVLIGATALLSARTRAAGNPARHHENPSSAVAELERREGGRLGVAVLHTGTGERLNHRENELFAMCSTFKYLAAAAILRRVDQGREQLDRWVPYTESDLLSVFAPVSKEHLSQGGMTLAELCSAAVEWSDNTAANLMLKILGGPAGLTSFIRSLGDTTTRLDRIEPELNVVAAGDARDTTSPAAMLNLLSTVLFGQVLSAESRTQLASWMLEAKVGGQRIPAGLPAGWRMAHKIGTWDDETNDVGVIWPLDRAPIIIAAFYRQGATPTERREGVLREVGRLVAQTFA